MAPSLCHGAAGTESTGRHTFPRADSSKQERLHVIRELWIRMVTFAGVPLLARSVDEIGSFVTHSHVNRFINKCHQPPDDFMLVAVSYLRALPSPYTVTELELSIEKLPIIVTNIFGIIRRIHHATRQPLESLSVDASI